MNQISRIRDVLAVGFLALPLSTFALGSLCDIQDRSLHHIASSGGYPGLSRSTQRAGGGAPASSNALAVHFIAAKALIDEGKPAAAQKRLDRAVGSRTLSPADVYTVSMLRARAHSALGEPMAMAKAYELALNSGEAPLVAVEQIQRALAVTYYLEGDLTRSLEWIAAYRKDGGEDIATRELEAKALFLQGNYAAAKASARQLIGDIRAANGIPSESLLLVWSYALTRTDDQRGYDVAMRALLHYYPATNTTMTSTTP